MEEAQWDINMNIELYTMIYNEERILPYFIDHYRNFVKKFIFYDNESTDGSVKLIQESGVEHEIRPFKSGNTQDDFIFLDIKNNSWKKSRGKNVDYIIICDCDELIYHNDMKEFLKGAKNMGVTLFKPEGFDMVSIKFPDPINVNGSITNQIKTGVKSTLLDKCAMFSPDKITEINFGFGCHTASPVGDVLMSQYELKMLHYKNISLEYTLDKKNISKGRVPEEYAKAGIAKHYFYPDEEFIAKVNDKLENAVIVI